MRPRPATAYELASAKYESVSRPERVRRDAIVREVMADLELSEAEKDRRIMAADRAYGEATGPAWAEFLRIVNIETGVRGDV